jgi:hypothetical protein
MSKISFTESDRKWPAALVIVLFSTSLACSEDPKYGGGRSSGAGAATGSGGANAGGANAGGANAGGAIASGGAVVSGGSAGLGGSGAGTGLDAGLPMYEQDDPNLHPPDSSYQRVEIPVAVTNVMSIDIDADERVFVLERGGYL